jgi:aspartate racemase
MASDVYPARLRAHDLSYAVPTAAEGEALDALIFGELSRGEVSPRGRALLADLTRRMQRDENCDAVVLGCTELPLLLDPHTPLALPALDSTRLLARAAIARALSSRV